MFERTVVFNQDLSNWDVPLIANPPANFAYLARSWKSLDGSPGKLWGDNRPKWGQAPRLRFSPNWVRTFLRYTRDDRSQPIAAVGMDRWKASVTLQQTSCGVRQVWNSTKAVEANVLKSYAVGKSYVIRPKDFDGYIFTHTNPSPPIILNIVFEEDSPKLKDVIIAIEPGRVLVTITQADFNQGKDYKANLVRNACPYVCACAPRVGGVWGVLYMSPFFFPYVF